jgi:acyl-CoA thioester hydrolase
LATCLKLCKIGLIYSGGRAAVTGTQISRPAPFGRGRFARFLSMTTRWSDNDVYGHLNNVVYYQLFDSAVNKLLVEAGLLDPVLSESIGLVAQSECTFFESVAWPEPIEVGVAISLLGRSSVRYRLAVFRVNSDLASAQGAYSHVYVDRTTRRPTPIPDAQRKAMAAWIVD